MPSSLRLRPPPRDIGDTGLLLAEFKSDSDLPPSASSTLRPFGLVPPMPMPLLILLLLLPLLRIVPMTSAPPLLPLLVALP